MLIAVINGIVINDCEPVLDSFFRQTVEKNMPRDGAEWLACWLLSVEVAKGLFGMKIVRTVLN